MKSLFYPTRVAVIGVSTAETNLARNIVLNLLTFKFRGEIFVVGRSGGEIHGLASSRLSLLPPIQPHKLDPGASDKVHEQA